MKKLPKFEFKIPQKIVPKTKRAKTVCLVLIFISLSALVAGIVLIINQGKDHAQEREVTQKLQKIDENENITCREVVNEIGGVSSEAVSEREIQKELLEKQMACFADQLQYDAAIQAAEKLKGIYSSESDSRNAQRMDRRIEDIKTMKAEDEAEANKSNDASQ